MTNEPFFDQIISPWMRQTEGIDSADIVLSTRIRLARNLSECPFPNVAPADQADQVFEKIAALEKSKHSTGLGAFELVKMSHLDSLERQVLVERHLVSPALVEKPQSGACLISENQEISIMVNEEDHLRIQCLFAGLQLKEALNTAFKVDDWLETEVTYAFDEKLGYLTSCPSNVGTGLRASVMMHLPALAVSRKLENIIDTINKMGLVVRGVYGEGSRSFGNIYQISNQVTLGKSEEAIILDLERVVDQIVVYERQTRESFLKMGRIQLEDRVFRSLGILRNARLITSSEAAQRLSEVRVGIDLGVIKELSPVVFNELIIATQPGCLQKFAGESLHPRERDFIRAQVIREKLTV